jgi:thiopeptide-type bacteriocin biosynthesis protein
VSEDRPWLSAHLFFDGDIYRQEADRLLLATAEPVVRQCLRQGLAKAWFFLRYVERGSHLRLRLLPSSPTASLRCRELVAGAAQSAVAEGLLERLEWLPYEPETDRYGGPSGVALAEEVFQVSSEAAVALLRKVRAGDRSSRLGKALLAMVVSLFLFDRERDGVASRARGYGAGYLRALVPDPKQQEHWLERFEAGYDRQAGALAQFVEAAWEALTVGSKLTLELDEFRRPMARFARRLEELQEEGGLAVGGRRFSDRAEAVGHLLPSYLHMMNNRLGVSIQEESYLAVLIYRTLEAPSRAAS